MFLLICSHSIALEPEELHEKLRQSDSLYLNASTFQGTFIDMPTPKRPGVSVVLRDWRFTRDSNRSAFLSEASEYEAPVFVKKGTSKWVGYNPDGNSIIGLLVKQVNYRDDDSGRAARAHTHKIYSITPSGSASVSGIHYDVDLYSSDDPGPSGPEKKILWGVGRGFSQYIEKITEIREVADGKIAVIAQGFESSSVQGRWEFVIDPAANWIVREAKFFHHAYPDDPMLEVRNSGIKVVNGIQVPETYEWSSDGPIEDNDQAQMYSITDAKLEVDEKLLEDVSSSLRSPYPPNTTVTDNRRSPPSVTRPIELLAEIQLIPSETLDFEKMIGEQEDLSASFKKRSYRQ